MDTLSRGITIILVGVLLFILPLQYINDNYEFDAHNHVSQETSEFTDTVRQQGYLLADTYNDFVNDLNATDELFDIEIEVASSVVGSEKNSSVDNEYKTVHGNKEKKAKAVFLGSNKYKNATIKNDLGLVNSKEQVSLLSTHTHTTACYAGHNHTASSCTKGGRLNGTYWQSSSNSQGYVSVNIYTLYCNQCQKKLIEITNATLPTGQTSSAITFTKEFTGGESFSTSASNADGTYSGWGYYFFSQSRELSDLPTNMKYLGCYNCGEGWICGITAEDTAPICSQVVISLVATKPVQIIKKGESIVTTAIATYLNGSTGIVNCTNNYNGNIGTQTVTLITYTGLVNTAKTIGTLTCTSTVTTNSAAYPSGIIVIPSSYEVYNGKEPTYSVTIGYSDNTSKVITSGYTKTGFTKGAGTKRVVFTYKEEDKTVTTTITIVVKRNITVCNYGHNYELDDNDVDYGCQICKETIVSISVTPKNIKISKGEEIKSKITVIGTYLDGHTEEIKDWTSDYNPNISDIQFVEIVYKNLKQLITVEVIDKIVCGVCGNEYDALEDGTDPGCYVCRTQIVSITATPKSITVPVGTDMKIKVIATFLDGHTAEIEEWSSNFDTYREGNQIVTIFYNKFTTTISVTVIGDTTICPVCKNEYSWKEHPYGCPVCSVTVESIEAYHKSESSTVTYGSNLSIYVILNYLDGHKEIAPTGWTVEGYNPTQLGEQTVIVRYGVHSTNLNVKVINNLEKVTCPNGHVYYLNDDGSNPGCPYCVYTDLDTGVEYITIMFTEDIITELELNNIVTFNPGDYITVRVNPRNIKQKKSFINTLYNFENKEKEVIYGGRIL